MKELLIRILIIFFLGLGLGLVILTWSMIVKIVSIIFGGIL